MFGTDTRSAVLVAGVVVLLAVAAAGGAFVGAVGAAAAQSGPSIGFSGVEDVSEGETDGATVEFADVSDPDGVGSFTVNVTYDPSSSVSLSASGAGAFEVQTATPEPGVLRVTGYTDEYPGPTGSGPLFSLSVTGESAADAVSLGLEVETFTDADGNDVSVSTGNATLAVEAADGGDGGDGGGGGGGGQPGGGADGEVEITGRTLLNDTVSTGEPVVAQADLANFDPADGRLTLTLTADGSTVAERTVTVGASSRRTVDLSTRFGTAGTYALSLNGQSIGEVTVETGASPSPTATMVPGTPTPRPTETPPPTTSPEATPGPSTPTPTETPLPPTTNGDGAGFGGLAVLLAVGLALLVARRRN